MRSQNEQTVGIWYAALSYLMWGFLPLYWKPLQSAGSGDVLAHRIIWSFIFMLLIILVMKRTSAFVGNLRSLFLDKKHFFAVLASSLLISANWLIYIWAVNSNHVVEASLGYYINPLISVLLGIIVLKEKLNAWQVASFVVALAGVGLLTFQYGRFPWVALSLALSFGLYGLAKKVGSFDSIIGLTYETMFVTPLALAYIVFAQQRGTEAFAAQNSTVTLLLMGAGVVTAIPLLCFAQGAKRISLSMIGFLQYIAPTIMLILGVFLYHEDFSKTRLFSFFLIWLALIIFSFSKTRWLARLQPKNKQKTYGI
ncbi:chloramphenicol-sensitive protein RarD [Fictibacillus enclensis]|uniref:Transporter n=1 Tax=Fictibacillus enclensis TaxID=1017270 RepID=A0A0V8JDW3_9BACL|nr:EamA family transporter RarD [Fictibacillus enclensis]KSU85314.1 transporter [Fictibacillus enclensis]SCB94803.1 chloramphenicol-sensitive protein RarD [Fictibacillus enclensis]